MSHKPAPSAHEEAPHGSLATYIMGFVCSLALTVVAYLLVVQKAALGNVLIGAVVGLALLQLVVQLVFFLHMGHEKKPRYNLTVFWFAVLVVVIVVFGSLWIMYNLDARMTPAETTKEIMAEEGIYR